MITDEWAYRCTTAVCLCLPDWPGGGIGTKGINKTDNWQYTLGRNDYIQCLCVTAPCWGHQETLHTETTRTLWQISHPAPQHRRLHRTTSLTSPPSSTSLHAINCLQLDYLMCSTTSHNITARVLFLPLTDIIAVMTTDNTVQLQVCC